MAHNRHDDNPPHIWTSRKTNTKDKLRFALAKKHIKNVNSIIKAGDSANKAIGSNKNARMYVGRKDKWLLSNCVEIDSVCPNFIK